MLENLTKNKDNPEQFQYEDDEGVHYPSRECYLEGKFLGLCSCGNPGQVRDYIKENLQKLDDQDFEDYDNLEWMFFVYWANDKGFAEHGTTARCSWLTEKGEELLEDLKKVDNE